MLVDKAVQWADQATTLVGPQQPCDGTVLHLHARRRVMACDFEVQYLHDDCQADGNSDTEAVVAALDLVDELEDQITLFRDHSEVTAINRQAASKAVEVEPRLFDLLKLAERLYQETGGAFDITSGPLSRAWGFLQRDGQLPTDAQISEACNLVGFDQVLLESNRQTIRFANAGMEINLHAIGKGYALDRAAQLLEEQGLSNFLWHGGRSSVLARGNQRAGNACRSRASSKSGWTIGLPHPLQPEQRLAEIHLHDMALSTAGSATQFFEHNGKSYGHLFDPRTGWPATGVYTATVIAPTAAEADALSTAFYIMGPREARDYCESHSDVKAILVCPTEGQPIIKLYPLKMQAKDWTPLAPCHRLIFG